MVKNETWVATRGRQVLSSHGWLKGGQEPTQAEGHRVGKARWDEVRGRRGVEKWPMEKPGDNPVSAGLGERR